MIRIPESELILNRDGSIYHLSLHPEQVADTIITVGDPKRVSMISDHFDRLDASVRKREFITHTGEIGGKRLTVISTGIGPDNIDIAINELDALVNIDLENREPKSNPVSLRFIRMGTSGSLHPEIPVDSLVVSAYGIGLDNVMQFYPWSPSAEEKELEDLAQGLVDVDKVHPYAVKASDVLLESLRKDETLGITLTSPGFYGPQGRSLRIKNPDAERMIELLPSFSYKGIPLTNIEMETSAIYGLSRLLGHQALSFNAILANRITREFSPNPKKAVSNMIETVLRRLI
ncbi:MAG: nucleoside phosphorylase [Saprospirales bacterium]|nr:nucleoside phosphorylase [Saprospirales bacterium]